MDRRWAVALAPLALWALHHRLGHDGDIGWNFEKFLVGKDGQVIARFSPKVAPDDPALTSAIEKALG